MLFVGSLLQHQDDCSPDRNVLLGYYFPLDLNIGTDRTRSLSTMRTDPRAVSQNINYFRLHLPEACSNLSTRNRKRTKNHFWQPAGDTRPGVPLSWSPQHLYNCGEELWLTCWLRWTPPVSRCRGGCWKTSQSRSPKDNIYIEFLVFCLTLQRLFSNER